jgi:RNA polymerase sigma-70 factor (ECF subfamily)
LETAAILQGPQSVQPDVIWTPSDEALVAGLAAGDSKAATAFVRRFQARVYGLAVSMVGDSAVAEELAQEAFMRAWRHAGAYDARRGRVATWLLSITRNLAIDHLRAKRTEPLDPDSIRDAESAVWATSAHSIGSDAGTRELRDSLAALPVDQRRALLLAALFGYTAREIGQIEEIPVGTAKTRIRTATQKLVAAEDSNGEDSSAGRGEEEGR